MHIPTTLTTLLALVATATTAPLAPRTNDAGCFSIASFGDSGVPHSVEAYIYFVVTDTSAASPISAVECFYNQVIEPTVAYGNWGTNCSDPSVTFGLQLIYDVGYFLTIAHTYETADSEGYNQAGGDQTVDVGTIFLGNNVTTVVDEANPNGDYEELVYATEFDVVYDRYP